MNNVKRDNSVEITSDAREMYEIMKKDKDQMPKLDNLLSNFAEIVTCNQNNQFGSFQLT